MSSQDRQVHIEVPFEDITLQQLADFICGDDQTKFPQYRSSMYLTEFFASIKPEARHDGSTRKRWTLEVLRNLSLSELEKVTLKLVDPRSYKERDQRVLAFQTMNTVLEIEELSVDFNGSRPILVKSAPFSIEVPASAPQVSSDSSEEDFLQRSYPSHPPLSDLSIDADIQTVIQSRLDELELCLDRAVPLTVVIGVGSVMEGLLLAVAKKNLSMFMSWPSAPKLKTQAVKPLEDWKLVELINASYDLGILKEDVKKFSHDVRDFRNYIHPAKQLASNFKPSEHTARICYQVLLAAFQQLKDFQNP